VSRYLEKLIKEGEHLRQDFKYCISDARKIARTFSAFANTEGGSLLIGVRDNGSVAGVESDEEYYMIESAATMYCKPEINFSTEIHRAESKTVIEIKIREGENKPYLAHHSNGRWMAYIRKEDQNLLANKVILNTWKLNKDSKDLLIEFRDAETSLIDYLRFNDYITLSKFRKLSGLSKNNAEWILAKLIIVGTLTYEINEERCIYLASKE
jgi:predicted HTH transcriptional regulator